MYLIAGICVVCEVRCEVNGNFDDLNLTLEARRYLGFYEVWIIIDFKSVPRRHRKIEMRVLGKMLNGTFHTLTSANNFLKIFANLRSWNKKAKVP